MDLALESVDPFRIRAHVADFDAIVRDIAVRSEVSRAILPMVADIAYGPGPLETVDIFFPARRRRGLPVHIFIHGGYWRMFSKRDYSYVADTITRAGAIAVILDYALMPAVRMATIIDQVQRAKAWLLANIARYGGDPKRLSISGHSAGAHLCTFLFSHDTPSPEVKSALLLGGLYDLKPLQSSFLAQEIALTDAEVAAFTPLTQRHDPRTRVSILVGSEETPPFHRQAASFARHLAGQQFAVDVDTLTGRHHMNSVRDLGIQGSAAALALARVISETSS